MMSKHTKNWADDFSSSSLDGADTTAVEDYDVGKSKK